MRTGARKARSPSCSRVFQRLLSTFDESLEVALIGEVPFEQGVSSKIQKAARNNSYADQPQDNTLSLLTMVDYKQYSGLKSPCQPSRSGKRQEDIEPKKRPKR